MDRSEAAETLIEIKEQMLELLDHAREALRGLDDDFLERQATSYWLAHIRTALDSDHEYLGGSMVTMQETIDALTD